MSADFYARLPAVEDFLSVADERHYADAPADWWVVLTDIEGSTAAVEAGRYRDVNFVGALGIAAVLNAAAPVEVPYVFGGDGATLLVPPSVLPAVRTALAGVQASASRAFGLTLRAGLVPVRDLYAEGHRVRVARFRAEAHYAQAVFLGGGLAAAERWVKDPMAGVRYRLTVPEGTAPEADFTGVECRWARIDSPRGETVTLLVAATDPDVYREVLQTIDRLYGPDAARRPVVPRHLHPGFHPLRLSRHEPQVRASTSAWARGLYTAKIWLQNLLLVLFLRFDVTTGTTRWRDYLRLISATTDHRKFDEMLRLVMTGTPAQREALEHYLTDREAQGVLTYGLHVSDGVVMTCLVYERMGRQVHFVDGADGGYTRAAQHLKARLRTPAPDASSR
ncbi:hypothetical protein AWN76_012990 [Rhodothermaceae bacterium RA]|nr:hypothetical protein AWN76_012990 [Rhodothermaceae bacterium RA]